MPRRKPTPEAPRRASGPTQVETERTRKGVLLRLHPLIDAAMREMADGESLSSFVEAAIINRAQVLMSLADQNKLLLGLGYIDQAEAARRVAAFKKERRNAS